jgi:plasmid maintenance system antidote protein VapI
MKMKYDKIYRKLRTQFSDEEIVDSMLIPADLTEREKQELASEMKEIRMHRLGETTEEDRIMSDVMRLRFQMESYLNQGKFSFEKTLGKHLKEYIRIVKKTRRELAEDLSIHYTKLSRIINDKEEPNIELCYRLEKHSGNMIKTELWWKLIIRKQGFIISKDEGTRRVEQKKVRNFIRA